jgi:hypothetical protein
VRPTRTSRHIGAYVPVHVVYPGVKAEPKTLVQLLSTMNRNETIVVCCFANIAVAGHSGPDQKAQQQAMIRELLPKGAADRIDAFVREKQLQGSPTVFFRGQLLELIRWAARYGDRSGADPQFSGDAANREKFAKAALICSDLWGERIYAKRLRATGDPTQDRQRALGAFRKGVEESGQAINPAQTLGRGWLLFMEHMPRRYPQFAAVFEKATGLTVRQYLLLTAALAGHASASGQLSPIISETRMAAATAYKELAPRYLKLESQTADELAMSLWDAPFATNAYRSLRERPLIRGVDDRMVISDPIFFSERVSIGPLFHVVAAVRGKKSNEVFGAFGNAFEDYAGGILDRMYPTRPGLVARLARNVKVGDLEIDAVMNDSKFVILIEMKAAWLREDVILEDAPDRLIERLRTLYGVSSDKEERPKGVAQLARLINSILADRASAAGGQFQKVEVFYPVLLVHDVNLSAPASGHFLNEEFQKLLAKPPPSVRVAPLIIMTISDLEHLESSVGKFTLRKLLADYDSSSGDRMQSLLNYIVGSEYRELMIANRSLTTAAEHLLNEASKELFPGHTDNHGTEPSASL